MNHWRNAWGVGLTALLIGLSVGALSMLHIGRNPPKTQGADFSTSLLADKIGNIRNTKVYLIDAKGHRQLIQFAPIIGKVITTEDEKELLKGLGSFEIETLALSSVEDPGLVAGRPCEVIECEVESGGLLSIAFCLTPEFLLFSMDGHHFRSGNVSAKLRKLLEDEIQQSSDDTMPTEQTK